MKSKFLTVYNKIIKESSLTDYINDKIQYEDQPTQYAIVDCETFEIIQGPTNDPTDLLNKLRTKEESGEWPEMKYGVVQRFNQNSDWEPVEDIWR